MQSAWLRFLPLRIRNKIIDRPNVQNALSNIGWLFTDKIMRMLVGLFVGVWVARYLGPEQFGAYSFALAFVGLFVTAAGMGLNAIVVRDLITEPKGAGITLGSAIVLQLIGGAVVCMLCMATIFILRPDDQTTKIATVILSLAIIFKFTDVFKYWFEARVQSKYVVWVENLALLTFAAIKIYMIVNLYSLMSFIWVVFAESVTAAIGLAAVFVLKFGHTVKFKPKLQRVFDLFTESWPLMLSALAIMVYMRIDQIMIGQMLTDKAVGIYSAAVRISEAYYFIPVIISSTVFPAIIEAKKKNEVLYYERLQQLFNILVFLSVVVAIPMTFFSDILIGTIYGESYHGAGLILSLHVWAGIFVSLGVASGRWFVLEGLQKMSFYRTLMGALLNIALNLILIPKFGGMGAAISTLVSYALVAFIFDIFWSATRKIFFMKLKCFALRNHF